MNVDGPVLVTGGAGYIGSHVALALRDENIPVVVLDDLSTGSLAALPDGVKFVHGSTGDAALVRDTLRHHRIGTVLHIAGSLIVSESLERPISYWRNNLCNTLALAESCVMAGVRRLVFSSTAAVYGPSSAGTVDEQAELAPISPYGSSKLAAERMLSDLAAAHGMRLAVLRYFNVAGSDMRGRIGQRTPGASHLIKVACEVATGQRGALEVFGADYDTPDGTCVRDFIHVSDLADAHVLALRYLEQGGPSETLNCGYGTGHSVRSVIRAIEAETGHRLPVRFSPRRPGDIPALVARAERVRQVLGWHPRRAGLDNIVGSSLRWERRMLDERPMAFK
ncbi:UDP-glucose 4-epimerase GalE [Lichenicoccus roseus]|uniref:UDP-glucose 4-epimerase n=1 Tax=Lichenicoccus roseus TaxID=2683649 RepID=A0A5R9J9L4_9PROT|nr:UDP-glucose 4-epimerase GalE [Lichenicoccus roseus]TLU70918.1 UDP-glucose 4-epimerase GalE [Lichenicoccus roseus]